MEYCLEEFIEDLSILKELVKLYNKGQYDEFLRTNCMLPLQNLNKQLACIQLIEIQCDRTVSRWSSGKYEEPDPTIAFRYWKYWVWIQDTRHNFVGREKARIKDSGTET